MTYLLLIPLGLAPSVIWLLFYLRKDAHPESNQMILKIFFYGMLAAVIAALIEIGFSLPLKTFGAKLLETFPLLFFLFYHFIIIALVEEVAKFLVVREKVIKDPEFDEPVDAMLYMIIVALGFAALENILVLFLGKGSPLLGQALVITIFRFIGATFLHALCSGTLGYFLALSFFETKKRTKLLVKGLVLAIILHGLFNISIIGIEKNLFFSVVFLIILLTGLALFVSFGFRKLKKIASICKIE